MRRFSFGDYLRGVKPNEIPSREVSNRLLVSRIESRVRSIFSGEGTGHDWHHIDRVRRTALSLAKVEGGDRMLIELAALLHDIADHKFHGGDTAIGPRRAAETVIECGGDAELAEAVSRIGSEISFRGAGEDTPVSSLEAAIVQDADRLDALGPIGIARTFAYGGSKGRPIHDPDRTARLHDDFSEYANSADPTIDHFHQKLLLLKDRMQTPTGRKRAEKLHAYMEDFLSAFHRQWDGE